MSIFSVYVLSPVYLPCNIRRTKEASDELSCPMTVNLSWSGLVGRIGRPTGAATGSGSYARIIHWHLWIKSMLHEVASAFFSCDML